MTAALVLGLTFSSLANAATFTIPAFSGPVFKPVKGTNKHQILLGSYTQTGKKRVFVSVSKGVASTSYTVNGLATTMRVRAKFGTLGRVDVRFVPNGRVRRTSNPGCTGGKNTERLGVWKGVFRFHGEKRYTSVSRIRVPGSVLRHPKLTCKTTTPPGGGGGTATSLSAFRSSGTTSVSFSAIKEKQSSTVSYSGYMTLKRGVMDIYRYAFKSGPASTFTFNNQKTMATVKPPGPFQGRGEYDSSTTPTTWKGTLRVRLLGAGLVRLAGPGFNASLF